MKTYIIVTLLLLFSVQGWPQPIFNAMPGKGDVQFYILSIDGEEREPIPALQIYNFKFLHDFARLNLPDGYHEFKLRTGNDMEESEDIIFYVDILTYDDFVRFEIMPDDSNTDAGYLERFDRDFAVAEVYADGTIIIKPAPGDDGNGDGTTGCFINTVKR